MLTTQHQTVIPPFKQYPDVKLVEYQLWLTANIKRCKAGWLPYMEELWTELLAKVETELQARNIVTPIKYQTNHATA